MDIFNGDCLDVLKQLADNSVDSVVTDPPYGLNFMNKHWDYDVPSVEIWKEVLRVLKPGGHLLSFGGTRTYHRMVVNIEDAGFEIRDQIQWIYGSGFPKSLNVGVAVDKLGGQSLSWFIDYILKFANAKGISRKELTMLFPSKNGNPTGWLWNKEHTQGITVEQFNKIKDFLQLPFDNIEETKREVIGRGKAGLTVGTIANFSGEKEFNLTKGTSEWEGWGTALKPANEPICLARKPISEKTVAENVLKWGTGGINIDGCRVGTEEKWTRYNENRGKTFHGNNYDERGNTESNPNGRFPANIIHDGSEEVIERFPYSTSGAMDSISKGKNYGIYGKYNGKHVTANASEGSASRFFYCAKSSKSERNKGCEGNGHPTVKPVSLMRYLCRLITPPKGTVLDPFMGSGSTGIGAKLEGFDFVGIEREDEYCKIAKSRIDAWEVETPAKVIIEPTLF
jgi:DNA modification methylase